MTSSSEITELLSELHNGSSEATARLMPLVHAQLHRIAVSHFAHERPGHTLRPTELLHEAFIRFIRPGTGPWKDRQHFYGVASRAMRQILVDHARAHGAKKRGGRLTRVDLHKAVAFGPERSISLLALDQALNRLARLSRRQSRIVELRFFGGLTIQETAKLLGIGVTVAKAEWALAKAWLQRELKTP